MHREFTATPFTFIDPKDIPPRPEVPDAIVMASDNVPVRGEALSQPVHWIGRQWAVTSYGVEKRDGTYVIERNRLWEERHGHGWAQHMAEKEWCDLPDFRTALMVARGIFGCRSEHPQATGRKSLPRCTMPSRARAREVRP